MLLFFIDKNNFYKPSLYFYIQFQHRYINNNKQKLKLRVID